LIPGSPCKFGMKGRKTGKPAHHRPSGAAAHCGPGDGVNVLDSRNKLPTALPRREQVWRLGVTGAGSPAFLHTWLCELDRLQKMSVSGPQCPPSRWRSVPVFLPWIGDPGRKASQAFSRLKSGRTFLDFPPPLCRLITLASRIPLWPKSTQRPVLGQRRSKKCVCPFTRSQGQEREARR